VKKFFATKFSIYSSAAQSKKLLSMNFEPIQISFTAVLLWCNCHSNPKWLSRQASLNESV